MLLVFALLAGAPVAEAAPADQPAFTAAACDDPVKRKVLLATDPDKLDVVNRLKVKTEAQQASMQSLVDRLAERAEWTPKQKSEFGLRLLDAPGLNKLMTDGFDLAGTMMKHMNVVLRSKDEQTNCHAIVDMMALLPKIDANVQQQWDAMRGVVEAEAKRLGISLD